MPIANIVLTVVAFLCSCALLFVAASILVTKRSKNKLEILAAAIMLAGALSGFYLVHSYAP